MAIFGAFAGVLLWSHIVKIAFGAIAALRGVDYPSVFGQLTAQKVRKVLVALFLASCIWVSVFVALAMHFMSPNISGIGWVWFFGGMATTPLFIWITTLKAARKIK